MRVRERGKGGGGRNEKRWRGGGREEEEGGRREEEKREGGEEGVVVIETSYLITSTQNAKHITDELVASHHIYPFPSPRL